MRGRMSPGPRTVGRMRRCRGSPVAGLAIASIGAVALASSTRAFFALGLPAHQQLRLLCGSDAIRPGSAAKVFMNAQAHASWGGKAVAAFVLAGSATMGLRSSGYLMRERNTSGRQCSRSQCPEDTGKDLPCASGLLGSVDPLDELVGATGTSRCAVASFVSSAKGACVHPDREFPNLCGDCPRNGKVPGRLAQQDVQSVAAAYAAEAPWPAQQPTKQALAAFVSPAKQACVHPDQEFSKLCGDGPRDRKMPGPILGYQQQVYPAGVRAAVTVSSSTSLAGGGAARDQHAPCCNREAEQRKLACEPRAEAVNLPTEGQHSQQERIAQRRCAVAGFVSSAKAACVHPDREFPYLCGDCPRN